MFASLTEPMDRDGNLPRCRAFCHGIGATGIHKLKLGVQPSNCLDIQAAFCLQSTTLERWLDTIRMSE